MVTRRGGLVAVDSKWRNTITAQGHHRNGLDGHQGSLGVSGAHRAPEMSLRVPPIVVFWGAAQRAIPTDAENAGVRFVAARELIAYLRSLERRPRLQARCS